MFLKINDGSGKLVGKVNLNARSWLQLNLTLLSRSNNILIIMISVCQVLLNF